MNWLIAMAFGAGVAAFFYSRFGRRIGYGNTQNQIITTGVIFVLASIVFYTILITFVPSS